MKTCHDVGCEFPECSCKVPDYAFSEHNRRAYCVKLNLNLDPIQNNCKYGYVLPDRCRYNSITGCDCGAYPPVRKQNG